MSRWNESYSRYKDINNISIRIPYRFPEVYIQSQSAFNVIVVIWLFLTFKNRHSTKHTFMFMRRNIVRNFSMSCFLRFLCERCTTWRWKWKHRYPNPTSLHWMLDRLDSCTPRLDSSRDSHHTVPPVKLFGPAAKTVIWFHCSSPWSVVWTKKGVTSAHVATCKRRLVLQCYLFLQRTCIGLSNFLVVICVLGQLISLVFFNSGPTSFGFICVAD